MKYYYCYFSIHDHNYEYEDSQEKIIEAKNKKKAIKKLNQYKDHEHDKIIVHEIYETTEDARI